LVDGDAVDIYSWEANELQDFSEFAVGLKVPNIWRLREEKVIVAGAVNAACWACSVGSSLCQRRRVSLNPLVVHDPSSPSDGNKRVK